MAATEPMLRIREGAAAMRSGVKVWVRVMMEKKFVSKVRRASSRGTSSAGRVRLRPLFVWDGR